jgi:predicted DNA-binding transcriptional regulator AlpA
MNVCEKETARILGVSVQTLRNWRHLRKGPPYVKLGRAVRYQNRDVVEYVEKHRIVPKAEVK